MEYFITGMITICNQHGGPTTERRRIKEFGRGSWVEAVRFQREYITRQGRRFSSLMIEKEES